MTISTRTKMALIGTGLAGLVLIGGAATASADTLDTNVNEEVATQVVDQAAEDASVESFMALENVAPDQLQEAAAAAVAKTPWLAAAIAEDGGQVVYEVHIVDQDSTDDGTASVD